MARSRLLGCADNYRFGVFGTSSGELDTLLDLRCAEHAVVCADRPEIQALCQPPAVEFCREDHWVVAPLCCVYERPDFEAFAASHRAYARGAARVARPGRVVRASLPAAPHSGMICFLP